MRYKWWIFISIGLFSIGMAGGLAVPVSAAAIFSEELLYLEELAKLLEPFKASTAVFIFFKNISAVLISFIFSPLLLLIPILALTLNGFLLSFISVAVIEENSLGLLVAGLLPHGIFEIPALIIGEAAALSFGSMIIIAIFSKQSRGRLPAHLKLSLRYMLLSFALLLPAAIIETFVTPLFLA